MRGHFGWAVLLAAAGACAQEQTPQEPNAPVTTLKLQARVVAVAAVVRDKAGKPVGGLTKEDFVLKQDGQFQEIRYFSQGTDLPLTLTLMVDTSGSQRMFIADETAASMVFFRSMLTDRKDRAALVQFDSNVLQLQPMTNSVDNLQRALDYLSYPHQSLLAGNRGGTLLYDAIVSASAKVLGSERGRKAMVLLTDGGDNGSRQSLKDAVAAVQRADVVVYSVFYSAQNLPGDSRRVHPSADNTGRGALEELASATGGQVFDVDKGVSLHQIFAQIAEDLRLQYQLGYRAPEDAPGSYHNIELKMTPKGLRVQTRKGFYTPSETTPKPATGTSAGGKP